MTDETDILDEVAADLLHEAAWTRPPVDAVLVAARLGICVAIDRQQSGRGRLKVLAGTPAMFLRPEERPERMQWAAAHEIGEWAAWRVAERTGREFASGERERVANLLAGRILLPRNWFFEAARTLDDDLPALRKQFRTASHELIALRFLDRPEPAVITIFDHGRPGRRRWNRPGRPPRLHPVERACWQQIHERGTPHATERDGFRVRGWPVHEPGWKREILQLSPRDPDACD